MNHILKSMFDTSELMVSNEGNNFFTTIYSTSEKGQIVKIDLTKEQVVELIEMLTDKKVERIIDLKAKGLTMDQINGVI